MGNERGKVYRRYQRRQSIHHKKRISLNIYGMDWFRDADGKYSKGHIGCGCGFCKPDKRFGGPSMAYEMKSAKWDRDLEEFNRHEDEEAGSE